MATSAKHRGWKFDPANSRLLALFNGTSVLHITASAITNLVATSVTGGITATTGNVTLSANDAAFVGATGNVKIGNPGAFATTQPRGAVVMGGSSLSGIAPVGAITTAAGIFASDTVVRKIIADGTASNVET